MGKIEGIFATNISGKVGNVVFRKNGTQNIVSQRPASVKNPRSDMQQRQRAYIKTVSSAYSVLRPICDHSFEGVAYGADSMNFFKKENYKIVSKAEKAVIKNSSDVVVPAPFLISKGSIESNFVINEYGHINSLADYMGKNKIWDVADVNIGLFLEVMGIKNGDQLTVINISYNGRVYTATNDARQKACNIYYSRYIFESGNGSEKAFVKESNVSSYYKFNPSVLAQESEINDNAVFMANFVGILYILDTKRNSSDMCSIIISRRNADKWLRSTATLYTDDNIDDAYSIENALPSYGPTGERYLNNAEK